MIDGVFKIVSIYDTVVIDKQLSVLSSCVKEKIGN